MCGILSVNISLYWRAGGGWGWWGWGGGVGGEGWGGGAESTLGQMYRLLFYLAGSNWVFVIVILFFFFLF